MTAEPSSEERVLAVVGNLTRVGGFMGVKQKACSLIITDRRIVFAELSKETIAGLTRQARDDAKAEGKGLLGQLGDQSRAPSHYHDRYWQMHPDLVLAESPENFAIERAAIKKVKFKTGVVDDTHNQSDQITIKTTSDKHKLQVNGSLSAAKEAFRAAALA